MSSRPLPTPSPNSPNTQPSPPVSDSMPCNSISSVPFLELSFNRSYYRTYTPGKGYSGNISMRAPHKFDGSSDDGELDDGEESDDDEDEGSGDEDEDEDDEYEGSEDDDGDEVDLKGRSGNENAGKAGTVRNFGLSHNTTFSATEDAAGPQPEDGVVVKMDGAKQVEKSIEVTSSCASLNERDSPIKIAKDTDTVSGMEDELKVEALNAQSSVARLPVGFEAEDSSELLGDGIEDFADSSTQYHEESNASESLGEALSTTEMNDLEDLFGEAIGDDIEISSDPSAGTAAAAERAIGVQQSQTAPALADLKEQLSEIVFKKLNASAAERVVLEKQRTELVRKITSIQRKLAREKDEVMKVNKTGNLKMPPPDKPDPWSLTPAPRPSLSRLTSSKSRSQKRKADEALDDNMLDTEVLPSMRKRKGRKLNEIEQAMEMAGLYPEDPDREEREQQRKEERAKEREREKTQRAWEREGTKSRKEKERIAKGKESGKGKKKTLWEKWSARMPWEAGRWTTQYEKSG